VTDVATAHALWAARWPQAAAELTALLTPPVEQRATMPGSEARVQSEIRLEAAGKGYRLWRNNNGAMTDDTGRMVRYGLGHESKALSEAIKSSDLIGWKATLVTPAMVGQTIARFVSVETKAPGWHLTPGDKRGQAQARWLAMVNEAGGFGIFADGTGLL